MRQRFILLAALVIVVGGVVLYRSYSAPDGDKATRQAATQKAATAGGGKRGGGGAAVPILSVVAVSEDFPNRRETIGSVQTPASVLVKARVDSQITEQHVTDGQTVKKGDLLFVLDDREIKATIAKDEATVARDQAQLAKAASDLARTQELIARNVAARQQLDQVTADNAAAAATLKADQAQLDSDRVRETFTRIAAPIDGRIGAVRVTPGNLVSAGDSTGLLTITQMKPLWVAFSLPERDVSNLREALTRQPPAPVQAKVKNDERAPAVGTLNFVDSGVDPASGTIQAKALFANEDLTLWPGQYVDISIDLSSRPNTVSIPTVAVQSSQKGPYVFVVVDGNKVQLRPVDVGGTVDDRIAVLKGVKPGDRVVVEGQLRLSDGASIVESQAPPKTDEKKNGEGTKDESTAPEAMSSPDMSSPGNAAPDNVVPGTSGAIPRARASTGMSPANAAEVPGGLAGASSSTTEQGAPVKTSP